MSSLVAKFEALMTKLNQQTLREPTMGEIAYMKAQEIIMENSTSQVEEANFVNNGAYVFQPTLIFLHIIIQGCGIMRIYHMGVKQLSHMCLIS